MKKRMYRNAAAALGISVFLWAVPVGSGAVIAQPQASSQPQQTKFASVETPKKSKVSLEDRVEQWIGSISQQEGWEEWNSAEREINTLGPGTHGWIIQLSIDGKPVGYMIVNATENGDYALSEYGQGETPLFSEKTLNDALSRQGLTPLQQEGGAAAASILANRYYYDALQSLWQVEINGEKYYLDAQTGESLPLDKLPELPSSAFAPAGTVLNGAPETLMRETFDPYEIMSWVQGEPISITKTSDLKQALNQYKRITYVGDLYENKHHVPLAVIGYSEWPGSETFLALSNVSQGVRYIPLSTAVALGFFYP